MLTSTICPSHSTITRPYAGTIPVIFPDHLEKKSFFPTAPHKAASPKTHERTKKEVSYTPRQTNPAC